MMSRGREIRKGKSVGPTRDRCREVREDCHRYSAAELGMRSGYWIWENRVVALILRKVNYEA